MRNQLAILCLLLGACAAPSPSTVAITGVTVIDVMDGSLRAGQAVLIAGNRIIAVGPTGEVQIPQDAELVEAAGGYLIPGLWDMHVHAMYEGRPDLFFPMFVANGVTGVREMASTFSLEQIGRIRAQIARGEVLGPRFGAVAGKIFEGPVPADRLGPEFMSIATPDEAREMVRTYRREGADFIKVYDHLSREVYFAIVDEAKRQGLPFVGHVPEALDYGEASDAGQKSTEHLWNMPLECFASSVSELRSALVEDGVPASEIDERVAEYESADCASLLARYARNETWQVPTLALGRARLGADDAELLNDERLRYIPIARVEEWKAEASRRSQMPQGEAGALWRQALKLVGVMHGAGVPMLAGSDTGLGNAYTFAGFSLHDELALLVEAGLPPLEALRAATVNPTHFLSITDSLGSIERGMVADLILLEANPLEDIRNTQRIRAVVVDGRLYRRPDLDRLLAQVEALNQPLDGRQ